MPASSLSFSVNKLAVVAVFAMCGLGASVVFGVNASVDNAVSVDAKTRAEDWSKYFISAMPNLDRLLAGGALDDEQAKVVSTAAKVGNVFRFKLYDASGNTVLESNPQSFGNAAGALHVDDDVLDVVRTRQPMVSLNDGTHERNMPTLYAESYVPVLTATGNLRAIVEAYVDQTKTAAFFKTSFGILAFGLAVATSLGFGVPMLAFLFRTKQALEVKHRVEFLASHDHMTSLLNRASFIHLLSARISELSPENGLAIVFFDVDDFKAINDGFGHEAGDEFLKHVAKGISALCSEGDFVARTGGDEFIVALSRRQETELMATVDAMMGAVRQPIINRGRRVAGRISAGAYVLTSNTESVEDAMHHADIALYQSKIEGKNTARLFSPEMEARTQKRREVEQLVRDAASSGTFEIHYQPLIQVRTGACTGFEALLRLKDREGGYVPPMVFIPIAESIDLINEIGKWVLEEATRTAVHWPQDMYVSVNLSVRQFADQNLLSNVREALQQSGLAPRRLELEVTESLLIENSEMVATQLLAIKDLGVSIAMDDFGTGYSSLGYLWKFGFNKLKIDRSFITALDVDEKKASEILDTIVMLAHKLGMTVTAEGIETERQAAVLATLACDYFQGYLYGRPVPATEIAPYLMRRIQAGAPGEHRPAANVA